MRKGLGSRVPAAGRDAQPTRALQHKCRARREKASKCWKLGLHLQINCAYGHCETSHFATRISLFPDSSQKLHAMQISANVFIYMYSFTRKIKPTQILSNENYWVARLFFFINSLGLFLSYLGESKAAVVMVRDSCSSTPWWGTPRRPAGPPLGEGASSLLLTSLLLYTSQVSNVFLKGDTSLESGGES